MRLDVRTWALRGEGIPKSVFSVLASAMLLGGCTLGPNFSPPHPHVAARFHFPAANTVAPDRATSKTVNTAWWASFHDEMLTHLEDEAAAQNLDVRIATERLAEARAQAEIAGAGLYPSLDFAGSFTREKPSKNGVFTAFGSQSNAATSTNAGATAGGGAASVGGGGIAAPLIQPFNLLQYGFSSVFDFDLWGKNRRTEEAALAAVEQSAEARRAVLLNIEAEIAQDYIALRADQTLLQIAEENLKSANRIAKLTTQREQAGLDNALDVADSLAQAASIEAQIPSLRTAISDQMSQIGLLLGRAPGALVAKLSAPARVPPVPPTVPIGLPSQLLTRRPDIREALAKLHETTAEIGVAEASFFPDITLSGSVSLQALQLSDLNQLNAVTYAIGPEITLPLFSGGKLLGALHLRRAQQRAAAIDYAKVVLTAFHEVNDRLTAYDQEQFRLMALKRDVRESRKALMLAQERYQEGLSDYLEVLTAQQILLAAEQAKAQSQAAISTDLVRLYQALGGGWEQSYPPAAASLATDKKPA